MQTAGTPLITNGAATGPTAGADWGGGRGLFTAVGTFAGTAATLEYNIADGTAAGTWVPVKTLDGAGAMATVSLAAAGMFLFELPPGKIRAALTGGAPAAFYARADRIPY